VAVTGVIVALAALPTSSVGTAAVRAAPAAGDASRRPRLGTNHPWLSLFRT